MNDDTKAIRATRNDFPMLMSAVDLQALGLPRPTAYALLNRADLPVVRIGRRRFMSRDPFFGWLDAQAAHETQSAAG